VSGVLGPELRAWATFAMAPARSTGAFSIDFGTVPEGTVTVRASSTQQKIDTEEIHRLETEIAAVGETLGEVWLATAPLLAEVQHFWAHVAAEAAAAAHALDDARELLVSLGVSAVDDAAKLRVAHTSYEQAEHLAETLVGGFNAVHSVPYRLLYGTALHSGGNPLGLMLAAGSFAVVGGSVFVADATLRGSGAATRSTIAGSGVPLENLRRGVGRAVRYRRGMGFGLVRLKGFRTVEASEPRMTSGPAGVATVVKSLKSAGEHDEVHDAERGPQNQVSLAHIDVQVVDKPDGTRSYLVSIPGTDFDNLTSRTDPNSARSILDAMTVSPETPLEEASGLMQLVDRALREAGAGAEDPVILSGFSQGGMAAMGLATNRDFGRRYAVRGVVTTGSPTSTFRGVDPRTKVLHLRDIDDPVPSLTGGGIDPGNDHAVVVIGNTGRNKGPVPMTHSAETYIEAAAAADRELGRTAEGRAHLRMIQEAVPAGSTVRTLTFEASSETYDRRSAAERGSEQAARHRRDS
jgi:hypothetical protein